MGAGDVSLKPVFLCFAASPCTRLSRARSTTSESDFALQRLPFSGVNHIVRHTRPALPADQDHSGSPRSLDASISERAVLPDPAAVSGHLAICGAPTGACQPLQRCRPADKYLTRLNCFTVRYGSLVALSTLSLIRYLLRPKTRFPVRRLHLLSGREFHPLEVPGLAWRSVMKVNIGEHGAHQISLRRTLVGGAESAILQNTRFEKALDESQQVLVSYPMRYKPLHMLV